jgi:gamma-tubulin complex component 3
MVHDWIYNGELQDPFDEFFIAQNDDSEIENEWKSKFSLRQSMVPSYITPTLARKVFLIGKSLNFIRHSCNDAEFPVFESQKQQLEYGDVKKLETSIDKAYRNSSKHLLSLILDTFQLRLHLHAIKKYILLSQGDFVQYLMDSLGPTLSKPATSIYRHNVTGTLESAIRSSNAQYDHPDVLKRLDVRLLDGNEGETGWDLFVLDFNPNPNNTILNQQAMHQYHRIFCFLWKIKRVEHCLSKSWQLQAQSKSRGKTVHQAQMVLGEMVHFINQLQRFVFYEVIECAWNDFMTVIDGDDSDLDTLIEAHETFLVKVMKKGLIDAKGTSDGISKIFNCVYKFSKVHSQFLEFDDGEMELLDTMQEFQVLTSN